MSLNNLTVQITSFSYKRGIPQDLSGNGGGFVFDCRAIHNPGKYDEYKKLTGLDESVIAFLNNEKDMHLFLTAVCALTDQSVEKYMARGFTNLAVNFGCTGGQHRSVYAAQHLAEHIHAQYGISVNLIHREQNIEQLFNATV
jgi:RNase adaptor protein for sRNA GlmZ degradation